MTCDTRQCPLCGGADQHVSGCELEGRKHVYFNPADADWEATLRLNGLSINGNSMNDVNAPAPTTLTPQQVTALYDFFRWAMCEGPWDGCDLDGGSIQDKAESLGLIVKTKYDPVRHGDHYACDEGDDYYEYAPGLLAVTSTEKPVAWMVTWPDGEMSFYSKSEPVPTKGQIITPIYGPAVTSTERCEGGE